MQNLEQVLTRIKSIYYSVFIQLSLMVKIILMSQLSHNFTHVKRQTSTLYIISAFSPALNPSSNYSITWQKSWYFPWDSMSYYPLTTLNRNHAPPHNSLLLPSVCLQHSNSLQIKPHCLSPFSSRARSGKGCCSFILRFFFLISTFV